MVINTHHFGEVEFNNDIVLKFENGLFGFEDLKEFLLLRVGEDLFYWLISVQTPDIAFPLIGLRIVDENYPEEAENEAFGIVTLNKDPLKISVNLKAPVYINQEKKTGYQKILDSDRFNIDYRLFVEE
jgi:flagellar assembly factor FliW